MYRGIFCCFIFALFACACAKNSDLDEDWKAWKAHFEKSYPNRKTEAKRRATWEANLKHIMHHNLQHSMGEVSYSLATNSFSDLTTEEFGRFIEKQLVSLPQHSRQQNSTGCSRRLIKHVKVPDSVDWRTKGFVSPVKNEGQCLSSLFFSVTGALEGMWAKKTGNLFSLSEQNIADCAYGKPFACTGIELNLKPIYDYIEKNGLEDIADYPDTGLSQKCMFDPKKSAAICSGYEVLPASEAQLKKAVAAVGPISATINASPASFQMYSGGVYDDPDCTADVNFAVLIVGYGTDPSGGDYWIVKNSWGKDWGENGYIRMSRNKDNQCGIASYTSFPYYTC